MRWVTYTSPSCADRAGLVVNDVVHALDAPSLDLLGDLAAAGQRARSAPAETLPLAEARLRAPVPQPPSVRDFLSFEEHAKNA